MNQIGINKYLYKILLSFIKYTPIVLAIVIVLNFILNFLGIEITILTYIFGVSATLIILLYLLSFVFRFCQLYRIPLHYITITNIISCLYKLGIFTITVINLYRLYFIIAGIVAIVYVIFMYKNRNNPKVDPIKQLCETYCDCNCD